MTWGAKAVGPAVWIAAASDAPCRLAADALGLAVLRHGRPSEIAAEIAALPRDATLVIDAATGLDSAIRALVGAGSPVIAAALPEDLDDLAALVDPAHDWLLCAPNEADWVATLAAALLPSGQVADVDPRRDAVRLQQLADEVARLAAAMVKAEGPRLYLAGGTAVDSPAPVVAVDDVRALVRLRRRRDALFGDGLFADPAWDMLLDLTAARLEAVQVPVSSLCLAAAVPPTTALRWMRTLTELGLVRRIADPGDRRRVHIDLSDAAATAMLVLLGEAKSAALPLV